MKGKSDTGELKIDMISVVSKNITAIGYDESTNSLIVRFKKGLTYKYLNVPKPVFAEFLVARSKGKFLELAIKPKYSYAKI